jgi:hypothetical protein
LVTVNLVWRAARPRYGKAGKDLAKDAKKQQQRAARQQVPLDISMIRSNDEMDRNAGESQSRLRFLS